MSYQLNKQIKFQKDVEGVLGIRTEGQRLKGAGESTELRLPT